MVFNNVAVPRVLLQACDLALGLKAMARDFATSLCGTIFITQRHLGSNSSTACMSKLDSARGFNFHDPTIIQRFLLHCLVSCILESFAEATGARVFIHAGVRHFSDLEAMQTSQQPVIKNGT